MVVWLLFNINHISTRLDFVKLELPLSCGPYIQSPIIDEISAQFGSNYSDLGQFSCRPSALAIVTNSATQQYTAIRSQQSQRETEERDICSTKTGGAWYGH